MRQADAVEAIYLASKLRRMRHEFADEVASFLERLVNHEPRHEDLRVKMAQIESENKILRRDIERLRREK